MPSLLAATIAFTGLILHVQPNAARPDRRAVLVDARPSHVPELVVADLDRAGDAGTWIVRQTGRRGPNARPWRYDLSGVRVRVVAGPGPVNPLQTFSFVPHLKDELLGAQTTDTLLTTVTTGAALNTGTAAYVDYSAGALSVPACYRRAAIYVQAPPPNNSPRCVAKQVSLSLPMPANTTWEIQDVNDPSRKIVFNSNALVQIRNDSPSVGQHQKHFAQLLNARSEVPDVRESDLECSPQCRIIGIFQPTFSVSVECSNNQWP